MLKINVPIHYCHLIQLIILQPLLFYLFHKLLSLFPTYYTLQFSFSQSAFHRTGTMSRL